MTTASETAHPENVVTILYTNHRSETAVRKVAPGLSQGRKIRLHQPFWFGESDWHKGADGKPEPQWFLRATDENSTSGEHRDFALAGIKAWGADAVEAALAPPPAQDPVPAPGLPEGEVERRVEAAMDAFYPGENWRVDLGCALENSLRDMRAAIAAADVFLAPPASAADGEELRSALRAILKLDPATTEFTLAGQMAEIAAKALSSEGR